MWFIKWLERKIDGQLRGRSSSVYYSILFIAITLIIIISLVYATQKEAVYSVIEAFTELSP